MQDEETELEPALRPPYWGLWEAPLSLRLLRARPSGKATSWSQTAQVPTHAPTWCLSDLGQATKPPEAPVSLSMKWE